MEANARGRGMQKKGPSLQREDSISEQLILNSVILHLIIIVDKILQISLIYLRIIDAQF